MSELDELIREFTKELQGNDDLKNAVTTINEEEILAAKELRKQLKPEDVKELRSVIDDSATWVALPSKVKSKISKIKNLVPDLFDVNSSISGNNAMVINQKVGKSPVFQTVNENINAEKRLDLVSGSTAESDRIKKQAEQKNRWGQLWAILGTPLRMEYAGAKTFLNLQNKYNVGQDNPVKALNKIYDLPLNKATPGNPLTVEQMAENRAMVEKYTESLPASDLQFETNAVPKGELFKALMPALKDAFLNKEGSGFEDKYLGDLIKEKDMYLNPDLYEELNKKFPKVEEVLNASIDETNFFTKYFGIGQKENSQGILAKMVSSLIGSPADILSLGLNIFADPLNSPAAIKAGRGATKAATAGIVDAGKAISQIDKIKAIGEAYPKLVNAGHAIDKGFKTASQAFSLLEKTPMQKIFNKAERERLWEMAKFGDWFRGFAKKANLTPQEQVELSYILEKPWKLQDVIEDVTYQSPVKKVFYNDVINFEPNNKYSNIYKELNSKLAENQSAFETFIEQFKKKYRGELETTETIINSGAWKLNRSGSKRWVTSPEGIDKKTVNSVVHGTSGYGGFKGKFAKEYGIPKDLWYNASDAKMGLKGIDDTNFNEFLENLADNANLVGARNEAGQLIETSAKEISSLKDVNDFSQFGEWYKKFNSNTFNKTFSEDIIVGNIKMGYLDELGDLKSDTVLAKEIGEDEFNQYQKYYSELEDIMAKNPNLTSDEAMKVHPFKPEENSLYGLYLKREKLLQTRDFVASRVDQAYLEDKLKTYFKGDWQPASGTTALAKVDDTGKVISTAKSNAIDFATEPKQLGISKEGKIVDDLGKDIKKVYAVADNENAVRQIFRDKKLASAEGGSKRFVTLYSNMEDAAKAANGKMVIQVGIPKTWKYSSVTGTMADRVMIGNSIFLPGDTIVPSSVRVFETTTDDAGKLLLREFDLDKSGTISYFKNREEITEYVEKIKQVKSRRQVPIDLKPNMKYAKEEVTKKFNEFLERDLDLGLLKTDANKAATKARLLREANQKGYIPGGIKREFWETVTPTDSGIPNPLGKSEQAFQKQKTLTLAQRKALYGADVTEENIYKLLVQRADEQFKAEMHLKLLPEVESYGKYADELTDLEIIQGWTEPKINGQTIKEFKGIYFSPENANILSKFTGFRTDEATRALLKVFDQTMHLMKGYMTVANAGFHLRNFYSNYWLLFLKDGMNAFNPASHATAIDILRYQVTKSEALGNKVIKLGKQEYTVAQLWEEAGKNAVTRSGYIRSDVGESLLQELEFASKSKLSQAVSRINPVSNENIILKGGDVAGGFIENEARLTGWLNDLKKGVRPDIAAENMKFFMIDYSDLSSMERNVNRRFIPFYSWLRKNMELEIRSLFEQPGKFALLPKLKRYIEGLSPEDKPGERARYMEEQDAIKMPWKQSWFTGLPEDENKYLYLNPNAPWQDLYKATDPEALSAAINPLIKVPAELGFNKELFFKREIESQAKGREDITELPMLFQKMFQAMPDDVFDKFKNTDLGKFLNIDKKDTGEITGRKKLEYLLRQQPFINNISKMISADKNATSDQKVKKWLDRISAGLGIKLQQNDAEANKAIYLDGLTNAFNAKVSSLGQLHLPEGQKYPSVSDINAILTDLGKGSLKTKKAYDKAEELKAITKLTGSNWAIDYIINQMKEPYAQEKENLKERNMKELLAILKANGITEEPTIEEIIKALQLPRQ